MSDHPMFERDLGRGLRAKIHITTSHPYYFDLARLGLGTPLDSEVAFALNSMLRGVDEEAREALATQGKTSGRWIVRLGVAEHSIEPWLQDDAAADA